MTKLLVLSRAAVGPRMASPEIRAYQIAGALGRALPEAEITLGVPGEFGEVTAPARNVRMQVWRSSGDAAVLGG